jgi:hypothetical protein
LAQRDENGKFAAGNGGGPGRPPRSREQAYLVATASVCTVQDWREIIKKATTQAKRGNHQARAFLASILLGKDPVAVAELVGELRSRLEMLDGGTH